jgi:hypothetical protein
MTSPILHIEFFDRAKQFRRAFETLPNSGQPPEWPQYLLFYHAIELALKAYLIQQGVSENDLKYRFGHDMKMLVEEAVNRGLFLPYGSKEMIADVGGQPPTASQATPPYLKIRYPSGGQVYSLGQFKPYMDFLFTAVASALGMSP